MRISDWSSDVCSYDLAALAAMKLLGQQFVMGETIDAAVKRADRQKGELASFDMLGEAARTAGDAQRSYDSYAAAIARSEERRVGKEFDMTCRSRGQPTH